MKTLHTLALTIMFAASAAAANAAEEQTVPTITVTAKRPHSPAVEHVPPRTPVEIAVILPTDMPEAEIDFHLAPIAVAQPKN